MKINNPLIKGDVVEIAPKVFCVFIEDRYERAMLFCRYQEFYESPFKEIRGKEFSLEKFMSIYRRENKEQIFTYPKDWTGFNIPSKIISKALNVFHTKTWGPYDKVMNDIYYYCENYPLRFEKPRTKWYLIGCSKKDMSTMDHEIAHGLYYTNKEYKKNCEKLLSRIKAKDYKFITKTLINMGYVNDEDILNDEIQAYMSTGLNDKLLTTETKKYSKTFIDNFNNFKP